MKLRTPESGGTLRQKETTKKEKKRKKERQREREKNEKREKKENRREKGRQKKTKREKKERTEKEKREKRFTQELPKVLLAEMLLTIYMYWQKCLKSKKVAAAHLYWIHGVLRTVGVNNENIV